MSDDDAIETAFHAVTEAQGGTHIADGGWWWLEGFGDLGKEYAAIRDDVAVWDVSPLNKWDFRGPAALEAAQRVFSNDALGLEVGQARYGAFLDADGLMVDDGTVFNTGGGHCWVMTNGKDHDDYFGEALEGFDAEFEWIAPRMPHLGVIGPRSREVVQKLTDADVGALRVLPVPDRPGEGGRGRGLLVSDRVRRRAGLRAVPDRSLGCRRALERDRRRGRDTVRRRGDRTRTHRGGLIVTDYDYEAHQRTPYDFNLDRLVRLDGPGEFLGKEKLREVAAAPPNRMVTLTYESETLPEYGATVTVDSEEVGVLTSPTDSPRFGKIGIAVIRTDRSTLGNTVQVAIGDGTVDATVDVLPIYDTNKDRPRS